MRVEEALIKLGQKPLRQSPYSAALKGIINGHFKRENVDVITADMPGDEILTKVYELEETDAVLNRSVGGVRDHDRYRTITTVVASVLTLLVAVVSILEVVDAGPVSNGFSIDTLVQIGGIIAKMLGG